MTNDINVSDALFINELNLHICSRCGTVYSRNIVEECPLCKRIDICPFCGRTHIIDEKRGKPFIPHYERTKPETCQCTGCNGDV